MTIIVHGPQGSGKTRKAPQLLRAFKLARSVDADELQLPAAGLWHAWTHQPHRGRLERLRLLILSHDAPPPELAGDERIMTLERAMSLASLDAKA